MDRDPVTTNPDHYRTVFENERVRVLEYRDHPGDRTAIHAHPDSVMLTLTSFRRRLIAQDRQIDVEFESGAVRWLAAQEHIGENIGESDTHVFFVELKEGAAGSEGEAAQLGPDTYRKPITPAS